MSNTEKIKAEIERLKNISAKHIEKAIEDNDEANAISGGGAVWVCEQVLSFIESLEKESDKLRYCIEYVNPRYPLLEGKLNIRHIRVPDEHWGEMMLTIILSFGAKIYALYRGNVIDGKLADWETPMVVDEDDWYSNEWLSDLYDCGHSCC